MIGSLTKTAISFFVASALAVMAVSQMTNPEPANNSGWHIETVGSEERGSHTSIDLDSNGYPHISYHEGIKEDLKYARWTGSNWSIETVDSVGNVGSYTSIALDSNDNPHISYIGNQDLKYAKWNWTAWNIETVDSNAVVEYDTSIALDSNDNPHISYFDDKNDKLKYVKWTGSNWSIEGVDLAGTGYTETSIDLDGSDNPHIVYHHSVRTSEHYLKYAEWTGSNWSIRTLDGGRYVFFHPSIALDSNDYPHISYADGNLKYQEWNGSAWSNRTLDSGGCRYTSLALDSNDNPHISYQRGAVYDLKYAMWTGVNWSIETVDSFGNVGQFSTLALDGNDNPHISYRDFTNDDLKYATKAQLAPPLRSVTLNVDPDTLNLKSEGRWITAYLTTENAKAEDIDASSLLLNDVVQPEWWDIQNDTTLMVKFDRASVQSIVSVSDSVDIKIAGRWKEGESFEALDTIRVIDPGRGSTGSIKGPLLERIPEILQEPHGYYLKMSFLRYHRSFAQMSLSTNPAQKMNFCRS